MPACRRFIKMRRTGFTTVKDARAKVAFVDMKSDIINRLQAIEGLRAMISSGDLLSALTDPGNTSSVTLTVRWWPLAAGDWARGDVSTAVFRSFKRHSEQVLNEQLGDRFMGGLVSLFTGAGTVFLAYFAASAFQAGLLAARSPLAIAADTGAVPSAPSWTLLGDLYGGFIDWGILASVVVALWFFRQVRRRSQELLLQSIDASITNYRDGKSADADNRSASMEEVYRRQLHQVPAARIRNLIATRASHLDPEMLFTLQSEVSLRSSLRVGVVAVRTCEPCAINARMLSAAAKYLPSGWSILGCEGSYVSVLIPDIATRSDLELAGELVMRIFRNSLPQTSIASNDQFGIAMYPLGGYSVAELNSTARRDIAARFPARSGTDCSPKSHSFAEFGEGGEQAA